MATKKEELTYREKLGLPKYKHEGLDASKDEPIVEQSHKDAADINTILARYERANVAMPVGVDEAFGDFSEVPDLQKVMNQTIKAKETFMELPAKTRKKFNNNPAELWNYLHDPENYEESVKLGLRIKRQDPKPKEETVSVSTVTSSEKGASK